MDLSDVIMFMISKMDGERSASACLHILRGKRSGQTLQDVEYFNLKPFFSIIPKLDEAVYRASVDLLKAEGFILEKESIISVTPSGWQKTSGIRQFRFNGWEYRGRESVFFARLSLAVQTLSNAKEGNLNFIPVQTDREIQLFVKNMLAGQPIGDRSFSKKLGDELKGAMEESGMTEIQKEIVAGRLSGFDLTGRTWDQLAAIWGTAPLSLFLQYTEGLHKLLDTIRASRSYPFLARLSKDIQAVTYLTDSAERTRRMFESGMTMDEISMARRLKQSTIEDHFVEMAINVPDFPLHQFVSLQESRKVVSRAEELGTRRLRMLKKEFEELSYFQLRLILGARTGGGRQ